MAGERTGRFFVIEGLDGAGTTTQAARLAAALRAEGREVVETHEPTDGPVGRLIRAALRGEDGAVHRDTLPWMFVADRSDHLTRLVEPALAAGTDVISDRYLHSSLAYQSLDRPLDQVLARNADFRPPDLTVYVSVPVDVCLARIEARGGVREIFEKREQLEAIAARYDAVLARLAARGDRIARVDGNADIDRVHAAILDVVRGA